MLQSALQWLRSGKVHKLLLIALFAGTVTACTQSHSAPTALEVHYSPEEKLDAIDVELVNSARSSIDLAAYVLTDSVVIDALKAAEARGVAVRIVLDPHEHVDANRLGALLSGTRTKHGGALMHLKGYEVDGTVLRSGSANFSLSGETQQDNDLIVIHDQSYARNFDMVFERIWDKAE